MSEAEQDAMEVAEELRKALAVKNREVAEKDAEIARLQKRCALLEMINNVESIYEGPAAKSA